MIRINLGRSGLGKGTPEKLKFLRHLAFLRVGGGLSKTKGKFLSLVFVSCAVATAILPQLFLNQYKVFITTEHETQVKNRKQRTSALDIEINKYVNFQTELQSYEQQKKLVSDRLSVVRDLLNQRGTPVSVLDTLSQSLPKKTWLKEVEFNVVPGKANILVRGESYSHEEISEYVERLTESVHLVDVALEDVGTRKLGDEKIDVKSFQVTAKPKQQAMLAALPPSTPPSNVGGTATKKAPEAQREPAKN